MLQLRRVNQHVLQAAVLCVCSTASLLVSQCRDIILFQVALIMDGFVCGTLATGESDYGELGLSGLVRGVLQLNAE